jgi:hypothetical protein
MKDIHDLLHRNEKKRKRNILKAIKLSISRRVIGLVV